MGNRLGCCDENKEDSGTREATCCGAGDVTIFACSGGSNVGQIANDAGKALDQLGQGRMSCAIGVGAQLPSFSEKARNTKVSVVIDGCEVACTAKALRNVGVTPHVHVVVTDLGVEKCHEFNHTPEQVAEVAGAVADLIQTAAATGQG